MARPPEFPDSTVRIRFYFVAQSRCECQGCKHHEGRCQAEFTYDERGTADDDGAWQAEHDDPGGGSGIMNCRILCVPCHKETPTYGLHG